VIAVTAEHAVQVEDTALSNVKLRAEENAVAIAGLTEERKRALARGLKGRSGRFALQGAGSQRRPWVQERPKGSGFGEQPSSTAHSPTVVLLFFERH
jgi:hypothetical protein